MPLKAQNDYIFYKFGGRHGPFGTPLATPMLWLSPRKFSAYAPGRVTLAYLKFPSIIAFTSYLQFFP